MTDGAEPAIQNIVNGATGAAFTKWTPNPTLETNIQDHDPAYQGAWWAHGDGPVWSGPDSAADKQAAEEIGYHENVWKTQLNTIYSNEAAQKAPGLNSIWSTPPGGLVPSFTPTEPQGATKYRYTYGG